MTAARSRRRSTTSPADWVDARRARAPALAAQPVGSGARQRRPHLAVVARDPAVRRRLPHRRAAGRRPGARPPTGFRWAPWGVAARGAASTGCRVRTDTRLAYEAAERPLARSTLTQRRRRAAHRRRSTQELLAPGRALRGRLGLALRHPVERRPLPRLLRDRADPARGARGRAAPGAAAAARRRASSGSAARASPASSATRTPSRCCWSRSCPTTRRRDSGRTRAPAALGTVSRHRGRDGGRRPAARRRDARAATRRTTSCASSRSPSATARRSPSSSSALDPDRRQTGVILTHGNHPDSLQLGLDDGRLWLARRRRARRGLRPRSPPGSHRIEAAVSAAGAVLVVDGREVARTAAMVARPALVGASHRRRGGARGGRRLACPVGVRASRPRPIGSRSRGSARSARWQRRARPRRDRVRSAFVLDLGDDADAVLASARAGAARAVRRGASTAVADRWRDALGERVHARATPTTPGYLPVLESPSTPASRAPTTSASCSPCTCATPASARSARSSSPAGRGSAPTTTFYWDQSRSGPRTAAMLEPVGLRAWILAALAQPYDASHSFDTRNLLPVGNHYASNDHALFRIVEALRRRHRRPRAPRREAAGAYRCSTTCGALAYRPAHAARHVRRRRARRPRPRRVGAARVRAELPRRGGLVQRRLRRDAALARRAAAPARRSTTRRMRRPRDADDSPRAVLGQYAGDGRWRIAHPDGEDVIGHCLDFELVAADMADDLTPSPARRDGRVRDRPPARRRLDARARPGRPDRAVLRPARPRRGGRVRGLAGRRPSYGLARLGRADLAAEFLAPGAPRAAPARSGVRRWRPIGDGRYRVAERGVSNRDSNAAVAVTEAVIAGLFGIRADFGTLDQPLGATESPYGTPARRAGRRVRSGGGTGARGARSSTR